MNWGDRFESHHYVIIFWEAALKVLLENFPSLSTNEPHYSQVCKKAMLPYAEKIN